MPIESLMLATKGAPTDNDTQTCCLGLTLSIVSIFYGLYMVAITDQVIVYYLHVWPRCDQKTLMVRELFSGSPKKKKKKKEN